MRLIEFRAENIKRIKAVSLHPDGPTLELSGRNRQGKTSILDSLYWLLTGTRDIQDDPIREGQDKAETSADLGDIIVRRTYSRRSEQGKDGKAYRTSLTINPKPGTKVSGMAPQELLNSIIGPLSLDPIAFMRASDRQQYEMLRSLVKDVDFDAIDAANAADYEARTAYNREIKQKRAVADGIVVPEDTPDQPIDESALLDRLTTATQHNSDVQREESTRAATGDRISELRDRANETSDRAKQLRAEADALDARAMQFVATAATLQKDLDELPTLPEPVDVSAASAELQQARITNKLIDRKRSKSALESEIASLEFLVGDLTAGMDERNAKKRAAIEAADLGVPGLGLGDDAVYLNGHPVRQSSGADQLQISMAIAMAANPQLKLVMIRDGNVLDDDSLSVVRRMAAEWDGLVIIERVDPSGKVGVVIEDGEVVAINPVPAEAA